LCKNTIICFNDNSKKLENNDRTKDLPKEHLVANNCKKDIMKGNFAQHFDKWIVMMMLMIE
jgi:hypothetical protein